MMKPIISAWAILCALPLLFSFTNNSVPPATGTDIVIKTQPMDQKRSFRLLVYNLEKKPTRIILQDQRGVILLNEKVLYHNTFHKIINLQKLGLGDYDLSVLQPDRKKQGVIKNRGKGLEISWNE